MTARPDCARCGDAYADHAEGRTDLAGGGLLWPKCRPCSERGKRCPGYLAQEEADDRPA